MATLANDYLFNLMASLEGIHTELMREANRDKLAVEQRLRQRIELLELLTNALYEACEAFETHYDAQLPYGHRSPLLVRARRAMEKYRKLREE